MTKCHGSIFGQYDCQPSPLVIAIYSNGYYKRYECVRTYQRFQKTQRRPTLTGKKKEVRILESGHFMIVFDVLHKHSSYKRKWFAIGVFVSELSIRWLFIHTLFYVLYMLNKVAYYMINRINLYFVSHMQLIKLASFHDIRLFADDIQWYRLPIGLRLFRHKFLSTVYVLDKRGSMAMLYPKEHEVV